MNELQADRMEQVSALIENRQQSNSDCNLLMLENLKRRDDLTSNRQKSKLQKSLLRKVKVLHNERFGKPSRFEHKFKKICDESFDFESIRENVLKLVEVAQSTTTTSKQSRDLSTSKSKLLRGKKPEKHLKMLYESVKETDKQQKLEIFECRKLLTSQSSEHDSLNFKSDDYCNSDAIEIQKAIKGSFIQNKLMCHMNDAMQSIQDFRRQFLIESVSAILPTEIEVKPQLQRKVEFNLEEFMRDIVVPVVTDIIQQAEKDGAMLLNQKLLQESAIRRRLHIEDQLRKQKLDERRKEIKTVIENVQGAVAEKVLNNVMPIVVEIISEEEATRFAVDEARKIDDMACRSNNNVVETVERTLQEFLVPEIEKRVEKRANSDEHTVALFGAYDSIEDYLRDYPN